MTATSGEAVVVSDRFEIDHAQPLPELDYGPSNAFAATDMRGGTTGVFAILPNPKLPLRLHAIARLRRIDNNNLLRPLAWQVVDWPADGRRRPAIVVERPRGERLVGSSDAQFEPFREENLIRRVLQPICTVLEDLAGTGIVHRNIRAENLYLDGDDRIEAPIMLGECVSAPAGYLQPAEYETIECGTANASGRGAGSIADDLYALGVTACILHTGRNSFAGLSAADVTRQKLALGSYAAFTNTARVAGDLVEVFRGLLNDDPGDRWGLEDLQMWLGGRRSSPRQQSRPAKSSLPLEVEGETHVTARSAADGLSRHWDEGLKLVESGAVDDWLRRGLADEDRIDAVNAAKSLKPGASESDITLARICIALDPVGPIRLRSVRAMLDGIGTELACRYADEQTRADLKPYFATGGNGATGDAG
ncbi:MAG: serine/threonine protein kinase, partial [Pseudomonadota bacterium]